jgi:hypothetical protein
MTASLRAIWDLTPDLKIHIEVVHRLNGFGAVITHTASGTSPEGFNAEWRAIDTVTVEADRINRCEIYDEEDFDAALASFNELGRPARRLENTASQVYDRLNRYFAARDWAAMAESMTPNIIDDDRQRMVNSGILRGRDAVTANARTGADLGTTDFTSTVIATRGDRLALCRTCFFGRGPNAFRSEALHIVEIDAGERVVAHVSFDVENIDDAFEELDARYLADEAAEDAHTWSAIARMYASFNRHELPATTPDWVTVDRRPVATFEFRDASEFFRSTWDLTPHVSIYAEAVHRLTSLGAVVTHVVHGTSEDGFDAEWRISSIVTVKGDLISGCELFDDADLDAALARFEELHPRSRRLEHPVQERFLAHFAARDWDAMGQDFADDYYCDDRRRIVNAGVRHGRDAAFEDLRVASEIGLMTNITSDIIATRGERLFLGRTRWLGPDQRPEDFYSEVLNVVEIDPEERIVAQVLFDSNDIGAAIKELDARYLAGEAATHAHTWSRVANACAAINRHELPELSSNWVNVDHRRGAAFAVGEMTAYLHDLLDDVPDIHVYAEVVHRLGTLGAVVTQAGHGTSQEGFQAEWREIGIFVFDGDLLSRYELFDETDLDAALARFDELQPQARRPENAATEVDQRFWSHFPARDWDAMAELLADNISTEDRRRVVNAGVRQGLDDHIAEMRAVAEVGTENIAVTVMATRGARLALTRICGSTRGTGAGEFSAEVVNIVEIDAENRISARVAFDLDDIDAAFAELDARYLAGEAAAHSHTWTALTQVQAAYNRHEFLPTTENCVNIDHRRGRAFAPGDMIGYIRATYDIAPNVKGHIEAVHRLTNLGAVATEVVTGTSQEGFDAEWREIGLFAFEGDLICRFEMFDEADLDAALARFDGLQPQVPRLENAASQVEQRFLTYFEARDWDAYAEILSDDVCMDDRRHVVNAGVRHGRDAEIASQRAIADVGVTHFTSTVIAIRGRRLALGCYSVFDGWSGSKVLVVSEINAENQIVARVAFDSDDLDAAFAELDARYLAGEAAPHAHIWTAITKVQAAYNRHEVPPTTADCVNIDHRPGIAFAPGDATAYIGATYDVAPNVKGHLEAVHRLGNLGVVVTEIVAGTSQEGFAFEWREVALFAFEGDMVCRFELFDEADLDAALARFDELRLPTPRVENAATRADDRFFAYFAARNWAALAEILTDESFVDDRRPVVNAGLWDGRDAVITNLQALADAAADITSVIATRGERLALTRIRSSNRDPRQGDFGVEMLNIVEIDTDERIVGHVALDPNDIDAAFEELEARYLVGEGAAHAHAWSVIARTYAAFNCHEFPSTTTDSVYIDHRPLVANDASDLTANIHATWELMDVSIYIAESVHRLSELGAVVTQTLKGTSKEGLDVEYRMIDILTVEGDLLTRVEVFDETDLDAALARFDELQPQARRLVNAASQVGERFWKHFAARDWDAMAALIADDIFSNDRRRVVNGGIRRGRGDHMADMRGIAEVLPDEVITPTVIATRGARLAVTRISGLDRGLGLGEVTAELFSVVELDADNRIVSHIGFDVDDIDAAIAELDARYLAGEAAPYANTWSAVAGFYAALNRHEILATPDWVNVDHRRATTVASGDMAASIRATWDLAPNITRSVEAVHRLDNLGAVVAHTAYGTSREGFDAEWRLVALLTFTGDLISRCELFDEADLDAALARFDELHTRAPRLETAATRAQDRFFAYYKAHDWAAIAETMADDTFIENRVRVVNTGLWEGRDVVIANMQALAEGLANSTSAVLAIRGERLALTQMRYPNSDARSGEFVPEQLIIAEIDTDDRIAAHIVIDPDDIDAAFAELDARYLAGEAAAYAHTWSVITEAYAAFNRHELLASDLVTVDHRRATPFESSTMTETLRSIWDVTPDLNIQIEAVHRLSSFGAVVTHLQHGTSTEGFDAEWRSIELMTVDGDRINYCEIFDEADVDAALARFDELEPQARRLENAATQLGERQLAHFAARDWAAMTELLADDASTDDRRRVVNAGIQHGRDVDVATMRALADLGVAHIASTVVATRGERLALTRARMSGRDQRPDAFYTEALTILEVDADNRGAAKVVFDPDDIDAAIKELDARYLAGEAAAHAHTWSVIARFNDAFNRQEIPATDWVIIDHRRLVTADTSDLPALIRDVWGLTPDLNIHIEAVHQLSSFGAVVTRELHGTSQEGFEAEWRMIQLLTVEGDRINRSELFDETDLEAALARFDELQPQTPRLENAAIRVTERLFASFAAGEWDSIREILANDFSQDDRRRVVGAGVRRGRDDEIADLRAIADLWSGNATGTYLATRGERLDLMRLRFSLPVQGDEAFVTEMLGVGEINAEGRIVAATAFDPDDIDAAFEELDARYLAGEASAYSHTWSLIAQAYTALNRRELPPAKVDWVNVDHRQGIAFAPGDMTAYIRAGMDLAPDTRIYIETVHRLNSLGAVITQVLTGTSHDGFDAEWREIGILTFEGDLISRSELYDETDLDAALTRFDELDGSAP